MKPRPCAPTPTGFDRAAQILRAAGSWPSRPKRSTASAATRATGARGAHLRGQGPAAFNPLIVHVDSAETAGAFVEWPHAADRWPAPSGPGPLTLVLPLARAPGCRHWSRPDCHAGRPRAGPPGGAGTAGGRFGGPVAAPSANPSGRISPTTAAHVPPGWAGSRRSSMVAPCGVGVESTIVGLTGAPTLLRPGGLRRGGRAGARAGWRRRP